MSVDPSNPYPDISGFLCPSMQIPNPRGGRPINVFIGDHDAMDRISKGYACGDCCSTFYTFQLRCPMCGRPTETSGLRQDAPQEIRDYIKGRGPEGQYAKPLTFDDAMGDVLSDPDVDHVTMKQLKPSKWGRGG